MAGPRKKPKNPPVMSHEFVIQNHADIFSCIAIVFILGLVFEFTAKFSRVFIFLQYQLKNQNEDEEADPALIDYYGRGILDMFTVIFQSLIVVVIHAVIQEYGLDKISRKLHLSKTKTSRFNESGQLFVWSLVSCGWAAYRIYENGYIANSSLLWEKYPHAEIYWHDKLFLLGQMSYWVHMYPELYLQKVRKDEIRSRVAYISLYLIFISAAYTLHMWRLLIVILAFHYFVEMLFHASRMLYFAEDEQKAQFGFKLWAICFPIIRLFILSTSILVLWFGLSKETPGPDFGAGNFNTAQIRFASLCCVAFLQLWMMWNFIRLQLRRRKEMQPPVTASQKKKSSAKSKSKKKRVDSDSEEISNGKLKRN